jgi:hypothetical protein
MSNDRLPPHILLASGRTIEKILQPQSVEELKSYKLGSSEESTYDDYSIYQWTPQDATQTCPLKIGDMVPASMRDSSLILIKRKGPIKKRDYVRSPRVEESVLKDRFQNYLDQLSQDKINQAQKTLTECNADEELVYRSLYHSFKMYRARDSVIQMAREFLNLIGQPMPTEHPYLVLDKMKEQGFDYKLVSALEKTIETQFELYRNEQDEWMEDLVTLLSSFHLFSKSLDYFVRFSDDLYNLRGFFFQEGSFLDWFEAGSMETWEPLGRIRNHINEGKDYAAYLTQKRSEETQK